MFELVYRRTMANVVDLRIFGNALEFENWLRKQGDMEPIDILDVRKKES